MELTAAQRKMAFAVIVFVLAGLGVYLLTSAGPGAGGHPAARHGTTSPASSAAQGGPSTPSTPAASPSGSSSVPPSPPPSGQGAAPNIYQWLPFTPAGLSSAAALTAKFGAAYGTFSYTQSPAAYVATLQPYATSPLSQQIEAAYATPGVASLRKSQRQVSTGSAAITSLAAFGPSSLTFVVSVTEHVAATKNAGAKTTRYSVTVTGGDTSWQVSGIQLAGQGNA